MDGIADMKLLGPQTEPRMQGHDIACVHTMAGYLKGTYDWWVSDGFVGTDSHYGIGGKWGSDVTGGRNLDGVIWQFQVWSHQADANLDGNPIVLSIETADNAVRPIQPWTPKQATSLVRLLVHICDKRNHQSCPSHWNCHKYGIPPELIPDTKPGRRGIGYHRQGIVTSYPDRLVVGGVKWSNATGKDCPTDARVYQLKNEIIPRVKAILNGEDGDFDMDEAKLISIIDDRLSKALSWLTTGEYNSMVNPGTARWGFADDSDTITVNEVDDQFRDMLSETLGGNTSAEQFILQVRRGVAREFTNADAGTRQAIQDMIAAAVADARANV